ncbi:MAG: MarR family transcriptional regulator [Polyangiaceae bacterium]
MRTAATEEPFGSVLSFMRSLWAMDHALQTRSKRMESTLGVTGPQRLVIRVIGRMPSSAAGEIAKTLHVHPSTLTGVLQRLEKRGFITRALDPADKRRALFRLTELGEQLDETKSHTVEAAVRRALRRVPDDVLATVHSVLENVKRELDRDDA